MSIIHTFCGIPVPKMKKEKKCYINKILLNQLKRSPSIVSVRKKIAKRQTNLSVSQLQYCTCQVIIQRNSDALQNGTELYNRMEPDYATKGT